MGALLLAVVILSAGEPASAPAARSFSSGRIVTIDYPLVTVQTYEDRSGFSVPVFFVIDVSTAQTVWRETWVSPTALLVGDDVYMSATGGAPRHAVTVDANIGRLDGVVREIDGDTVIFESLRDHSTRLRATVSRYLRADSLPLADLRIGDTIGAVVYYERDTSGAIATRRITRMWR